MWGGPWGAWPQLPRLFSFEGACGGGVGEGKLTCTTSSGSYPEGVCTSMLDWWKTHTCQPMQFTSINKIKSLFWGGYGRIGNWIQENKIFIRFWCCFKLSEKSEKLSNEQLTHAIAKCTLTGLVQKAKKSCWKWGLKSCMWISYNTACSFHCHRSWLEFKMPLPPAKNKRPWPA